MMTTERYAGKLPLFMGVREATFRRKILPGDTLEIHVSLLEEKTERWVYLNELKEQIDAQNG